jgi:Flp pilus assembly protein TadB
MAISLSCKCGRALRLKDELAGKRIRCPQCQEVLAVPLGDDVETGFDVVERNPKPTERAANDRAQYGVPVASPIPQQQSRQASRDDMEGRPRRRRKRRSSYDYYGLEDEPRGRSSGIAVSRGIITGVCMMIGAVVWLVVGLFLGWLFFYPPVLFILGLIAVVRGFMGYEED